MTYPTDRASREVERQRIKSDFQVEADLKATQAGRSMKCNGLHNATHTAAHAPDGCQNSGEDCLCSCHDQ
jgi:hypothetical protein